MQPSDFPFLKKLEAGQQLGKRLWLERDGRAYWITVGVQKIKLAYRVYISEIREDKMITEEYEREVVRNFTSVQEASQFIETTTVVKFDELTPCKGQKIFNPNFASMHDR